MHRTWERASVSTIDNNSSISSKKQRCQLSRCPMDVSVTSARSNLVRCHCSWRWTNSISAQRAWMSISASARWVVQRPLHWLWCSVRRSIWYTANRIQRAGWPKYELQSVSGTDHAQIRHRTDPDQPIVDRSLSSRDPWDRGGWSPTAT